MEKKQNIYEIITERIIHRIETEGRLPWSKPWKNYLSTTGSPQNIVTKKPYRGINTWVLSSMGYKSPFWLTYKQALAIGGNVKKGEKGSPVVYWLWVDKTKNGKPVVSSTGRIESIPCPKYYTVFNLEQCENIEIPSLSNLEEKPVNDLGSLEACEAILQAMPQKPEITFNESQAYYSPSKDLVNMPRKDSFKDLPSFYATFFHELTHSTGHESRCARKIGNETWGSFGSEPYAKEELVAEMGSAYLCAHANIEADIEDQSVAYLQGWISRLRKDPKLLIQAGAQAQKACDFILGVKFEESKEA